MYLLDCFATSSSVQGILLALHSEITCDRLEEPYEIPRIELRYHSGPKRIVSMEKVVVSFIFFITLYNIVI